MILDVSCEPLRCRSWKRVLWHEKVFLPLSSNIRIPKVGLEGKLAFVLLELGVSDKGLSAVASYQLALCFPGWTCLVSGGQESCPEPQKGSGLGVGTSLATAMSKHRPFPPGFLPPLSYLPSLLVWI